MVVVVFQWGWGAELLGISGGPIDPFIPLMLFAVVFGLSMDYEVFMLSRIKEEYDRTGDAVTSVADGLASTARVITAAAAIMVVIFGSFMFEDIREIKLFGLGLALAVFIDATLVRMIWCRLRWSCSASATGGCRSGSTGSCPACRSSAGTTPCRLRS